MTSQSFKLENLSCPSCIVHLEAMEDDLTGVKKVEADYKRHTMRVEYEESDQSTEGIVAAVSAMGYVAIPVAGADNSNKENSKWTKFFR